MSQITSPFDDEMNFLASQYPRYAASIRNSFLWYEPGRRVRLGTAGCEWSGPAGASCLDLYGLQVQTNSNFFSEDADLHPHLCERALAELGRTNVDRGDGRQRLAHPEFDRLPVRWPEAFRNREINNVVRISEWDPGQEDGVLRLQRATYLDQLATNIQADVPIEARAGQSFRELDRSADGGLKPFNECVQANTIGVAALFVDREGVPIQRWRGKVPDPREPTAERLAVMKSGWHCGSSGALTWEDVVAGSETLADDASRQRHWLDGLVRGMVREIEKETGVLREEGRWRIAPYHFARELKRAGKPQFFFLVQWPQLSGDEVDREILSRTKEEGDEYRDTPSRVDRAAHFFFGRKNFGFRHPRHLRLATLSREALKADAEALAESSNQTYENYAAMYFAAGLRLDSVTWCEAPGPRA